MILHMDIDAFFASVEKLLVPALAPKPVAVGSGCIASCCYLSRGRGLHAGMSLGEARRRCPELVILPGRQSVYKAFAERVWEIGRRYSPSFEAHLDDAYLDLAGTERLLGEPEAVARSLREDVRRETGLAVTVGVAPSRAVARLAGKSAKPGTSAQSTGATAVPGTRTASGQFMSPTATVSSRGFRVIRPGEVQDFLDPLPVGDIPGVGPKTRGLFDKLNVNTVAELRRLSLAQLTSLLGLRRGACIYERARGRDTVAVSPREVPRTISRRTTFHKETSDPEELRGMLSYLCERAVKSARELGLAARSLEVVLCYADFVRDGSRARLAEPVDTARGLFPAAWELFERVRGYERQGSTTHAPPTVQIGEARSAKPLMTRRRRAHAGAARNGRRVAIRLVGVVLSRLVPAETAGFPLFEAASGEAGEARGGALDVHRRSAHRRDIHREERLADALDDVRGRFGFGSVVVGPSIALEGKLERDRNGFVLRTPCLTK